MISDPPRPSSAGNDAKARLLIWMYDWIKALKAQRAPGVLHQQTPYGTISKPTQAPSVRRSQMGIIVEVRVCERQDDGSLAEYYMEVYAPDGRLYTKNADGTRNYQ